MGTCYHIGIGDLLEPDAVCWSKGLLLLKGCFGVGKYSVKT